MVCVHKSHHTKLSWGQSIAEINILVMVMGGRLTWFFLNDGHGHGGRLTSLWTQSQSLARGNSVRKKYAERQAADKMSGPSTANIRPDLSSES